MTLFEKIYWTLFAVNAILLIIFLFLDSHWVERHVDVCKWMVSPIAYQAVVTLGYLIAKLLLWIWGESVDLFPSCYLL